MTDFYTAPSSSSPSARRHHRRKQLARIALFCGVTGGVSLAISAGLLLFSQLYGKNVERRFLVMAAIYLAAAVVLLLMQKALKLWNRRLQPTSRLPAGQEPFDAHRRYRRGGALIVVLGVVALVALLVAHVQVRAAMSRRQLERDLLRARLQAVASEAAFYALHLLAEDDDPHCDHTNESWCVQTEWKDPSGTTVRLRVVDQNRFFDINNLVSEPGQAAREPADILADLMTLCGDFSPEERVTTLQDWMDTDSEGVWEASYYARQNRPGPVNRPLTTWQEWLAVQGFDRAYFRLRERATWYEPFKADPLSVLTVLPGPRRLPIRVNVNTASATVLTGLLGLASEDTAVALVNMRNKRPFRSIDELMWAAPDVVRTARSYLDTRSRYFTIHVQASAGDRVEAIFALAERGREGQIEIRHWVTM